ncbi:unnamed protein product, partial [Oppiella nova]
MKLFHVFNDSNDKNNILFVTNNDSVYGLGANCKGCLGLGHDIEVKTPQMIPELCDQRIRQFINGSDFVLAINEDNHVFSWGHNHSGQCGRKVTPFRVYLKPEVISYLNDKNITHICCGSGHTLALTTGGQVYGWGSNSSGQIGCGDNKNHYNRFESYFMKFFEELSTIGSGGFGTVFKVKHRFDEQLYAVKRVQIKESTKEYLEKVYKEAKKLSKLSPDFVVQYYNSWNESKHLYIQMEYCSQNLRNILEVKAQVFGRELGDGMDCVEYFISCEILRQILESVQYLHELDPQIIHR